MPSDSARWISALSACLEAVEREQAGAPCPVVDHELIHARGGPTDELGVWLICRTREEQRLFRDTGLARFAAELKRRMLAAGFSEAAVAALTLRITSRDDVAAAGGRMSSFR